MTVKFHSKIRFAFVLLCLGMTLSLSAQTTWTSRTSAADNGWRNVTYGNGTFVAVAQNNASNQVMTSPDGSTWTSRTAAANNFWNGVAYGNGLFVAVAFSGTGNRVMTSPDGITWTSRTSPADNAWNSVIYANNLFVAVAGSGTGNRVMTSPDGINWTLRASAADNPWNKVTYGNGLFVAVASTAASNQVMTSSDGINWTSRTAAANNSWMSVTYGNNLFVAVSQTGTGNRVMTSPDGINWTSRTAAVDNRWFGVTYGNGTFVAVAIDGTVNRVMTSTDGITWTSRTSAADNQWIGATYANGLFVVTAQSGTGNRVMTSGTFVPPPAAYSVTGGGSYCTGSAGVAVGLANSETGVTYQLKKDGNNDGIAVNGSTSNPISFGTKTAAGTYTVVATKTSGGSTATMTGSATITLGTTVTPLVIIAANPGNTITAGTSVTFTATPTHGGSAPTYTWNGDVPTTSNTYISSTLANEDVVNCLMTSNATCPSSTTATSNTITMIVTAVLSVELLDFKVQNTEGAKNHLSWRTASEKNNSHFDIERSTDGSNFHNIGQVRGNNKPSSYQFVDNQPFAMSYYRLRQIDFDGTETLSKVISIATKSNSTLKIYPNPVSNTLTVEFGSPLWGLGAGSFQILNLLGQQVLTGKTAQQIDLSALPQGSYVLKVGAEQVKFVKQE